MNPWFNWLFSGRFRGKVKLWEGKTLSALLCPFRFVFLYSFPWGKHWVGLRIFLVLLDHFFVEASSLRDFRIFNEKSSYLLANVYWLWLKSGCPKRNIALSIIDIIFTIQWYLFLGGGEGSIPGQLDSLLDSNGKMVFHGRASMIIQVIDTFCYKLSKSSEIIQQRNMKL